MNKKPNIIIFMTDQQNADTIYSNSKAKTPNIDKFRETSVSFDNAYTIAPHCCPSRAACFSGLYPSSSGIWNNVEVDNALSRTLYDDIRLFPEQLKEAGYHNVFSGKWHISAYDGPLDRGFDEVLYEHISNYGRAKPNNRPRKNNWEHIYSHKERIKLDESKDFGEIVSIGYPKYYQFGVDENPFGDNETVDRACRFIEDYDTEDSPLFMYIGTTGPHDPYCPPREFIDLYSGEQLELPVSFNDEMKDKPALYRRTRDCFALTKEEHLESLKRYYAFVSYEDYLFGKVVDSIRKKGIWDNTYILYMTDHGDYAGAHGLWSKGLPCFHEAYRICLLIGGGLVKAPLQVSEFASITDIAPTVLEMAGVEPYRKLQGESLLKLIDCSTPKDWRKYHFTQTNGNEIYGIQRAIWDKKWKYVYNSFDYDELYDLEDDPNEMHNLLAGNADRYKGLIKDLWRELWRFARKTNDNFTSPYIMVRFAPYGPGIILDEDD